MMMMPWETGVADWEDGGEDIRIDNMSLLWRDPGANRCVLGNPGPWRVEMIMLRMKSRRYTAGLVLP